MNNHGAPDRGLFGAALKGVSVVVALLAAFFLGPLLYSASAVWVMDFTYRHYASVAGAPFYIGWAHVALSGMAAFFGVLILIAIIVPPISGRFALRLSG